MKRIHKTLAAGLLVAALGVTAKPAFGYGVEGWPNRRPDHVIQAQQQKADAAPAKASDKAPQSPTPTVASPPPTAAAPQAAPQPQPIAQQAPVVTVTGRNYCVSCRAWRKGDMHSECVKNGHSMVFRVREAQDAQGRPVPALKGKIVRYTPNDNAQRLAKAGEYLNKVVTLTGSLSSDNRVFTVAAIDAPSGSNTASPGAK